MVYTESREDMVVPPFDTDMSYHVSKTHPVYAHCWPGIHRITVGKQYCKYQWHARQPSWDIGFICIEPFLCFQCFNPLRQQLQCVALGFMCISIM